MKNGDPRTGVVPSAGTATSSRHEWDEPTTKPHRCHSAIAAGAVKSLSADETHCGDPVLGPPAESVRTRRMSRTERFDVEKKVALEKALLRSPRRTGVPHRVGIIDLPRNSVGGLMTERRAKTAGKTSLALDVSTHPDEVSSTLKSQSAVGLSQKSRSRRWNGRGYAAQPTPGLGRSTSGRRAPVQA